MKKDITILRKTIKTNKLPDVIGFVEEMRKLGAKVTKKENNTIVIRF